MLIQSRPRGYNDPTCQLSGQNVFYMGKRPQRPSSAPVPKKLLPPRKPACAIRKPKRVLQGSNFEAKMTSKFHERCLPSWVPAPAQTSKSTKARQKETQDRRQSYPLCLVCEYDHDCCKDESIHELYEKFQAGALKLEQLDHQVRSKAHTQKAKVLDALWKMDVQSRKKIAEEITKEKAKKEPCNTDDGLTWQDILESEVNVQRKKKKKKRPRMHREYEFDADSARSSSSLTLPGDDDVFEPDMAAVARALVHKDFSETDEKNLDGKKLHKKLRDKEKLKATETSKDKSPNRRENPKKPVESPVKSVKPTKTISKKDVVKPIEKTSQIMKVKGGYDKARIIKGSPTNRFKKPKEKRREVIDKEPAVLPGKLIRSVAKAKNEAKTDQIPSHEQVKGQKILDNGSDPDLKSPKESSIPANMNEDDTRADDVTLSDNGIRGTNIYPVRDQDERNDSDPLGAMVDQCNKENNFGEAKADPNQKNWNSQEALTKREKFKKRYTRETTTVEDDMLKDLVDKEFDLEKCLNMIENTLGSDKLVQGKSKMSSSASGSSGSNSSLLTRSSIRHKGDAEVFTEIIIEELKKENRDLKFALVARNQRLEDAASKVVQLVEQNTYLTQKVERAAIDHAKQSEELVQAQKSYEIRINELTTKLKNLEERQILDKSVLNSSGADLEATIHELTDRLKRTEEANKNLQIYIDNLKKSYKTVFGNVSSRSSAPSSLSHSQSTNQ